MRVLGKFVVCLALLLAALAVALARPLPAVAVWGDNNEPMPVLFGMELGSDVRGHPELEQWGSTGLGFPENWDKWATYEGIPAYPKYYITFECKISSVSFSVKVKDFSRFREIICRKFGNEILRGDEDLGYRLSPGYYWGKYEVEVWAEYPFDGDTVKIEFHYLPLYNQFLDYMSPGIPDSFTYHGVTLGRKVEEYPFLHPIKEEAPDIVYYQSGEPPITFAEDRDWQTAQVEFKTWLAYQGIIYSLELRGDNSEKHFMDQELIDMYKLENYDSSIRFAPEVRLGDYTFYFKPGLTVMTHMPTYWRMLRAKASLGK